MNKRVIVTLGVAMATVTTALPGTTFATNQGGEKPQEHKITICHANHSATGKSGNQPYVRITVDHHAVVKGSGHGDHTGPIASTLAEADTLKEAGTHWGDIIPPVETADYPGLNWTTTGQAIYNNNCRLPMVTALGTTKPNEKPAETAKEDTHKPATTPAQPVAQLPATGSSSTPLVALALGASTAIATAAGARLKSAFEDAAK